MSIKEQRDQINKDMRRVASIIAKCVKLTEKINQLGVEMNDLRAERDTIESKYAQTAEQVAASRPV